MKQPGLPKNERARLSALRKSGLLDSKSEERFDRYTRIAAKMFDTPIALVSLVDESRQWFKSKIGLSVSQTDRCVSFCGHAVAQDDTLIVEDALMDDRFSDNPLVTGEPHIRFYAGAVIRNTEGMALGTLCIIDVTPRAFSEVDLRRLRELADLVSDEIAHGENETTERKKNYSALTTLTYWLTKRWISGLLSAAVGMMVLLIGSMFLENLQEADRLDEVAASTGLIANLRGTIETELNSRLYLTKGLAGLVRANGQVTATQFQQFAKLLGEENSAIRSLQLAPGGVVTMVWPREGNEGAIGHDLLADPNRAKAAQKAIDARDIWMAGPLTLLQGGTALIGRLPVFLPDDQGQEVFWGFATILIDLDSFFDVGGLNDPALRERIAIRGADGEGASGEVFLGDPSVFNAAIASTIVSLPSGSWEIGITKDPSSGLTNRNIGAHFTVLTLIASFISLALYSLLRAPRRLQKAVRLAIEERREAESRFHDAVENMNAGLIIFDAQDRMLVCNRPFKELFSGSQHKLHPGITYREIVGVGIDAGFLSPEQGQTREDYIDREVGLHLSCEGYREIHLTSGRWIRLEEHRTYTGGIVGFVVDITQLKENELQLAEEKEKAEAANKAKSLFLATISHELRTPMNVILGTLELLSTEDSEPDKQKQYTETAHRSAQQLLSLLNQIIDINKIEANKFELYPEPVDLPELIRDVVKLCEPVAQDKGINIGEDIDGSFSRAVVADRGRLQQILLNLVSNAIKFSEGGQVSVSVSSLMQTDESVSFLLSVKDSGPGFPDGNEQRIFELFTQLDNKTNRMHEGAGLGLAITRALVDLMGGQIRARNLDEGGGCLDVELTFTFAEAIEKKVVSVTSRSTTTSRLPEVLLAEDSMANQVVFKAMLDEKICHLTIADNGEEAVEMFQKQAFDMVFMDVYMPIMDGIEATKKIRAIGSAKRVPIVALTANAMKGDRDKFLAADMDDYLAKPASKDELAKMIDKWVTTDGELEASREPA